MRLTFIRPMLVVSCLVGLAATAHAGVITVQPIKVCDNTGANCANNGGELYTAETNKIWAQAGISFNFLDFTTVKSTDYQNLDNQTEVDNFFSDALGASANANVISMWFVLSHFNAYGEVNAIGGNKLVIDQVIFSEGRLDTIAHEIGHLLGLQHDDPGVETDFLMRSGADRQTPTAIGDITPDGAKLDKLTAAQITTAQADVKNTPEPGTWVLLSAGTAALVAMRRKLQGRA